MRLAVKPYPRATAGACAVDGDCPGADHRCFDGVCVDVMNDDANEDEFGRDVWLRQWHSGVPEIPSWSTDPWPAGLPDHDRPFTEAQLGSTEGVVLLRQQCLPNPPAVLHPILVNELWIYDGCPAGARCPVATDAVALSELRTAGDAVSAIETTISGSDGRLDVRPWTGRVASGAASFPTSGFAIARIHTAAADGAPRVLDVVIGGASANGGPSSAVWLRDSATAANAFVRHTIAGPALSSPRLFVNRADGRVFALGDSGSGRVWELTGLYAGQPRWVGAWPALPNGLWVDADAVVADPRGDRAYLVSSSGTALEVSVLAVEGGAPAVRPFAVAGAKPAARTGAAVALWAEKGRLFVYGGVSGQQQRLHDLWSFDLARREWKPLAASAGDLPARSGGRMLAGSDGTLYLAGGEDAFGTAGDRVVWALDPAAASPGWHAQSVGAPRQLLVGTRTLAGTYRPGAPVVIQLGLPTPPDQRGTPVQVRFSNPGGRLMLAAIGNGASTPPMVTRAGTAGTLSFAMRRSEEWYLIVGPRYGEPALADDRSYTLTATVARTRSPIASLSTGAPARFDAAGGRAVVADWDRVAVLVRAGGDAVATAELPATAAADVVVDGRYAYVADLEEGLRVVDVGDPAAPLAVGGELPLGSPSSIAKLGSRVYLGAGPDGVQVIDVSDPTAPRWVDTVAPGGDVVDVSAADGVLTVSLLDGRVELYEADAAGGLSRTGAYQSTGWVEETRVSGDELHVVSTAGVVEVVDIRKRIAPQLKGLDAEASARATRRFGDDFAVQKSAGGGVELVPVEPEEE
jgi:hypothetical protein